MPVLVLTNDSVRSLSILPPQFISIKNYLHRCYVPLIFRQLWLELESMDQFYEKTTNQDTNTNNYENDTINKNKEMKPVNEGTSRQQHEGL